MLRSKIKFGLLISLLAVVLVCCIPTTRGWLLRSAGRMLVTEDPLANADVVVLSVDSGAAEVLEAAELLKTGIAPRVAVVAGPQDTVALEFARRGLPYADRTQVAVDTLHNLGVAEVSVVDPRVDGSNQEAEILPGWCKARGYAHVILIVPPDHSRRIRRLLQRKDAGNAAGMLIRFSRYSTFHADSWWRTRDGIRIELIGLQKLLADTLDQL